jgi:predicted MFS family arabinose efflux permease
LVRWTASWPRRRVFVYTLVCLAVSQVLSALAPGLALLAASRVLCALTHGLMWSIIAPIGARLVPESHTGRATTAVYVGTSAALIVGNPMTTTMSLAWGWRTAVLVIGVAAAAIAVLAWRCLPELEAFGGTTGDSPSGGWYRNSRLLVLCALTLVGVTAHFVSYTFVVPIIRDVTGADGRGQALLLAAYGATGLMSMALLARATDKWPRQAVTLVLAVLCLAFWLLASGSRTCWGGCAILVWGACAAVLPPILQASAIRACPRHTEPASALYVTAFQVGIVAGSVGGGYVYGGHDVMAVVATSAMLFGVTLIGTIGAAGVFRAEAGPGLQSARGARD